MHKVNIRNKHLSLVLSLFLLTLFTASLLEGVSGINVQTWRYGLPLSVGERALQIVKH